MQRGFWVTWREPKREATAARQFLGAMSMRVGCCRSNRTKTWRATDTDNLQEWRYLQPRVGTASTARLPSNQPFGAGTIPGLTLISSLQVGNQARLPAPDPGCGRFCPSLGSGLGVGDCRGVSQTGVSRLGVTVSAGRPGDRPGHPGGTPSHADPQRDGKWEMGDGICVAHHRHLFPFFGPFQVLSSSSSQRILLACPPTQALTWRSARVLVPHFGTLDMLLVQDDVVSRRRSPESLPYLEGGGVKRTRSKFQGWGRRPHAEYIEQTSRQMYV
ncbi:hypothetical protein QBC33DRAFT_541542 [Phialemonium atrogriseum]|uniref:Uncharacterized protein n=1 Tax=Phialemonium atrogriseum TaxID=1093897 RepID=A0AAJ0C0S9_9PEZI|nr:uncharacterized protein QBC33DRAFT_541542 [Phialemonium atrogriseum]KAK1766597.1 hypothetical protein QBC33DRAFT_541542 [Phialemonium atrogriseum]